MWYLQSTPRMPAETSADEAHLSGSAAGLLFAEKSSDCLCHGFVYLPGLFTLDANMIGGAGRRLKATWVGRYHRRRRDGPRKYTVRGQGVSCIQWSQGVGTRWGLLNPAWSKILRSLPRLLIEYRITRDIPRKVRLIPNSVPLSEQQILESATSRVRNIGG